MKQFLVFILLILSAIQSNAQVETNYYLNSDKTRSIFKYSRKNTVVKKMPPFDLEKMRKEDAELEGEDVPYRFGKGFDVNYSFDDGQWEAVEGGRLWTISFKSEKALSLNYIFENFYLPEGASLYIENQDETVLYGPVTSDALSKNYDSFLTDIIPGNQSTIFLFEPLERKGESKLMIKRVVHGYRGFFFDENYGIVGNSSSCNYDVACLPAYEKESNAVALVLLSNGNELCSGSLLMNTNMTFDPYFLTAFHCIDRPIKDDSLSDSEINAAENWMFKFCFKKASCNGSNLVTDYTYNKADFCSAWKTTDFALMKLKDNISQNENLMWLGWDRTGNIPTSTTCIHHPAGDVMKISVDYDAATSTSLKGGSNNFWQVDFDYGITQGGSSGSPLLNQYNRVIGQLYGGPHPADTCDWTIKRYGKFNLSWTGGGSNNTKLSNWLDPLGTNQTTMDSFKPSDIFVSGKTVICDTANYVIIGLPSGFTINWGIDNNNFSISPSGYQCLVTYTGTQQYTVANLTANVKWNGTTIKTLTKRIVMHGTDLVVYGEQESYYSSNGLFPYRSFTIPANNGSRNIHERINREVFADKESLPINFIEDNTRDPVHPPVDLCGYGITDINGGNRVYLNSNRFDGMDISFSGFYSPTYFYQSGGYVSFDMPYNSPNYPVTLHAQSDGHCHDFCLTFNVVPLPGVLSGDDIIWVNIDGSMLYVTFMYGGEPIGNGQYYFPSYSVTIFKIPSGTLVYSNTFSGTQTSFSVNTSTWTSGIYTIGIVCNGNLYSKSICL